MLTGKVLREEDRLISVSSQDCTAIANDAKARHNEGLYGSSDVKHVARLPQVIVEKYCNDNKIKLNEFMGDPVHIKRLVMNPDNAMFRIWPGNL